MTLTILADGKAGLRNLHRTVEALMQDVHEDARPLMQRNSPRYIEGRSQLDRLTELDRAEAQARWCAWKAIVCLKASTCTANIPNFTLLHMHQAAQSLLVD